MKTNIVIVLLSLCILSAYTFEDPFPEEQYEADLIELSPGDEMFYWLFESRQSPSEDPLVVWLTGGPGCSSEFAAFYENGPYHINDDLTLTRNEYSWNEIANVLYLDQPLGTGFSTTNKPWHYARNEDMVAEYFYKFLIKFIEKHPEYVNRPFYITGESYAGHYIPAITEHIVLQNNSDINMVASAIGNGWVAPYLQYPQYVRFAVENGLIGAIKNFTLTYTFDWCQKLVQSSVPLLDYLICETSYMVITGFPYSPAFNPYDVREGCDVPPLCYDSSNLEKYINQPQVREALNVGNRAWADCRMKVALFLLVDNTKDLSPRVNTALENGVGILAYSGDKDFICNWRGGEAWTNSIEWEKQDQFKVDNYTKWDLDGEAVGEFKQTDHFTFLRIYEAGHMVPMDQPKVALEMLKKFINREF